MVSKKSLMFACDFETTVYEGQASTEVWSAAYSQLYSDNTKVHHDIGSFFHDIFRYRRDLTMWFHNLRFDGAFIVTWLLSNGYEWTSERKPFSKQFKTLISEQNRWYSITINHGGNIIEIRDSVKLMPMTLKDVGKAFNTEHQKKEMEYEGYRYAGCSITKEEMEYIINDVLVLKEALEFMIDNGHTKLTIGSCALSEYKQSLGFKEYKTLFPRLDQIQIDESIYGAGDADVFIRKTYKGGWCYLRADKKGHIISNGVTLDVNSLYPSMMHSKSSNVYPVGRPKFFKGKVPEIAKRTDKVYFVMIRCRFELKEGMLPTIQIKGNPMYRPTEWLTTSDVIRNGKRHSEVYDKFGELRQARPTLYLTGIDYEMFKEHYEVYEEEIVGGCYFYGRTGLFDEYIDKWMEQKINAKSKGERTESKLFQNNLYGKFSSSRDSSYLEPYLDECGVLQLKVHKEEAKTPGYIAIGSMVTSYARRFTITHAQKNYDIFVYSDTDSIHLDDENFIGVEEHESALMCWKREGDWSSAIFIRQKTYAEFIRKVNGEKVRPHWDIKCAGMPERSKELFLKTHPITDFKEGLSIGGKLTPKRIQGGIILKETKYTLQKRKNMLL